MGDTINFVIFPLSFLGEDGIVSFRFHAAAGPGTRVSFICMAQYSADDIAQTYKSYNRVKSRCQMNERKQKSCQLSCIWKLA